MMGFLGIFNGSGNDKPEDEGVKDEQVRDSKECHDKLRLRKEELDVRKSRVDVGKVEFAKEIIEEQHTLRVPVMHEEVVIERRSLNEPSDKPIEDRDDEHFSLSLSEEKVEIGKHTVVTGEVSAYKREIEESQEINETVRHEEARINKNGDANVIEDSDLH